MFLLSEIALACVVQGLKGYRPFLPQPLLGLGPRSGRPGEGTCSRALKTHLPRISPTLLFSQNQPSLTGWPSSAVMWLMPWPAAAGVSPLYLGWPVPAATGYASPVSMLDGVPDTHCRRCARIPAVFTLVFQHQPISRSYLMSHDAFIIDGEWGERHCSASAQSNPPQGSLL